MTYRLFIDDIRAPIAEDWLVARTSSEALGLMANRGCPIEISFDHDLGGDDTAMVVVKRMIELDIDAKGGFIPPAFTFAVHSANPVGRDNILGLLGQYLAYRKSEH